MLYHLDLSQCSISHHLEQWIQRTPPPPPSSTGPCQSRQCSVSFKGKESASLSKEVVIYRLSLNQNISSQKLFTYRGQRLLLLPPCVLLTFITRFCSDNNRYHQNRFWLCLEGSFFFFLRTSPQKVSETWMKEGNRRMETGYVFSFYVLITLAEIFGFHIDLLFQPCLVRPAESR